MVLAAGSFFAAPVSSEMAFEVEDPCAGKILAAFEESQASNRFQLFCSLTRIWAPWLNLFHSNQPCLDCSRLIRITATSRNGYIELPAWLDCLKIGSSKMPESMETRR